MTGHAGHYCFQFIRILKKRNITCLSATRQVIIWK